MKTKRVWAIAIAGLLLTIGALVGTKMSQFRALAASGRGFSAPAETVSTTRVEATQWQPTRSAVGTLVAVHGVMLGTELAGTVREIRFDSGAAVKKDEVLVRLDTSVEEAQLTSATADVTLARLALERSRRLRASDAATQADLDAAVARAAQAEATVQGLRATIAKKVLRAPFAGRIAIRQVELGQVVAPGTPLLSLQSVDPIYADFFVPQKELAFVQSGQTVHLETDGFREAKWDGTVSVVNSEVDPTTRNVKVRAIVSNLDGRLLPGMYVRLEIVSPDSRPVLLIPSTAVLFAPYGDTVFGVEEKEGGAAVAHQKFVRLGERRGDFVAVLWGLEAGDSVVTSGGFKLKNGAALSVKNELAPKAELEPHPLEE
jgi:membrane fusion protein, multidrug efflux system